MLAVWLFVAFWVVLGVGLFFVAIRGGVRGAREVFQFQGPGARRFFGMSFVVIYLGFGLALPALFLTGNHANANAQVGGLRLSAAEKTGRELFGQHCGFCHTLAAANAIGKIGPNLDTLPNASSGTDHQAHDRERVPTEPGAGAVRADLPRVRDDARQHPPGAAGRGRRQVRGAGRG